MYADVSFKPLVQSFPETPLGISVAIDGQIFQTDVYLALHPPTQSPCTRKLSRWGDRVVVVLIGIRLGTDGVNPIYYDVIPFIFCSRAFDLTSNGYEGAAYTPTISWHSRRGSFVIILLRWFTGKQSLLLGPSSYTRDCPLTTAHAGVGTNVNYGT